MQHSSKSTWEKKIIILGGYGNVGKIVVKDLLKSGFSVGIAGRDETKIDEFLSEISSPCALKEIINLKDTSWLISVFSRYDIIVNCLEYTFNATIIDACIEAKRSYVDMGDSYDGILRSHSLEVKFKQNNTLACLGAGSSPGIVNVVMKKVTNTKDKIDTITLSFADILKVPVENMLPFNFKTVVDEIYDPALVYEDGKHFFIQGGSRKMPVDFGPEFGKMECYITNHDEQYSMPVYLKNKGIKNFYFLLRHNDDMIQFVPLLKKFDFLSTEKIEFKWVQTSHFEMVDSIMRQFLPQNYQSDDKEILYIKIDETVMGIINYSVDGVPAGIMNTGIGASLIVQYIANNQMKTGVFHPEELVDEEWMISELKKRNFEIQIDGKNI